MKSSWSKSYFLICFLAACFASVCWTSLILFAVVTHRLTGRNWFALFAFLVFLIWAAKEMRDGYRGKT